ncbi:hypothetical protein [Olsenella urininfantis]|uniref:hypothetical protein n=1 Tax=Olsenella urininfantis TaxID=1871033 RepID=UPI00098530AC|nr:hypothetical protein [Olsenella urininfantis]
MKEVVFTVEGVEGEFSCDADQLTDYDTAKLMFNADGDMGAPFEVMERIFMGRDSEYMRRLGGNVSQIDTLVTAAMNAVGEDAKNSSASPQTSNATGAK